ncbi:hypothetical protein FPRO06_13800 [Fusarium proliferatum]|nr:hypothetical protein FPRO06_13800 [Fusarium proliferatum]
MCHVLGHRELFRSNLQPEASRESLHTNTTPQPCPLTADARNYAHIRTQLLDTQGYPNTMALKAQAESNTATPQSADEARRTFGGDLSPEMRKRLQDQEKEFQAWRRSGAGGTDGSWNTWVELKRRENLNCAARGYPEAGGATGGEKQVKREK